jgi:acetolactate synthase-1/2/3 large subunit
MEVEGSPETLPQEHPARAPDDATHEVAGQIAKARRPILLAGAGILRGKANAALAVLLEATGMPLATSFMAKGLLPPDHPQNLGAFGLPSDDHVDRAIHAADLILTVGLDPVEYPLEKLQGQGNTPVVSMAQVSLASTPGWTPVIEMVGDLAEGLSDLARALETRRWPVWPAAEAARARLHDDLDAARGRMDRSPPDAAALSVAVGDALEPDDLLISGVGTHKLALARNLQPRSPGQVIIGNGLAGMGIALPGAIAAARLGSYGKVLAVCGDGEVMMNVQEMETATRLDLPMTVVVWVDGGFGLIEDKQQDTTGSRPDLSFARIDWAQLAGTFGWSHLKCDTASQLRAALKDRSASGRRLITVPVSYESGVT